MLSPLPDEIISEILSPALRVDDDIFTQSTSGSAPFARFSESTSACLLVCKSWLRVATPLLYNVVVIRSKAQAKALATVLAKNAQLGTFIRKLRVEGGYGAPMQTILLRSPNISDLFLCFNIFGTDNTDGLCKGLAHISPIKLILDDGGQRQNKHTIKLTNALVNAIPRWERLACLDLTYVVLPDEDDEPSDLLTDRILSVSKPIMDCQRLTKLVVAELDSVEEVYTHFKACPLKVVRVKEHLRRSPFNKYVLNIEAILTADDVSLQLEYEAESGFTRFRNADPPEIVPSLDPFFVPMAGVSLDVQEHVWTNVLQLVLSNNRMTNEATDLQLLTVCKMFLRCGRPFLYEDITLRRRRALCQLGATLSSNAEYGQHIRSITFSIFTYSFDEGVILSSEISVALRAIMDSATSIVRLVTTSSLSNPDDYSGAVKIGPASFSWDDVVSLSSVAGATLRELVLEVDRFYGRKLVRGVDTVFAAFLELRSLGLTVDSELAFNQIAIDKSLITLPKLEHLTLGGASSSLMIVLGKLSFPSLRSLAITAKLPGNAGLHASACGYPHNRFQRPCILELCPKLTELTVAYGRRDTEELNSSLDFFKPTRPNESLTKMSFALPNKHVSPTWEHFFAGFASGVIPHIKTLGEITLSYPVEWPTTEREINKSTWARIANNLLAAGVQVSDRRGTKWRSRLSTGAKQSRPRKRKAPAQETDDED
ncbi:HEME-HALOPEROXIDASE domain-containing protein [Mycena indigotica]|uniref:HEME-HALOPEROXIDASE domain-containing protein n=1 Tax=Mycena indigotica TaxID=2126181 RepID=A0A8H6S5D7_9AGAR|nr:HEME-HALOPEROXIDASE domain-containing protein [Mycena indigotica]KAF7293083.1 HEME-HALOPEROXIDASE domain-containing protein [Mycena indigotica]